MWGALCSQKGRGEKKGVWVPLWNTLQIYAVTCWNMSRDVSLRSWRHHVTCIPHHLMALRVPTPVSDQLFVNILYLFCSNCDKVPFMVVSKFLYLHRLVSMLCSIFRQVFLLLVHSVYLFVSVHNWYFFATVWLDISMLEMWYDYSVDLWCRQACYTTKNVYSVMSYSLYLFTYLLLV